MAPSLPIKGKSLAATSYASTHLGKDLKDRLIALANAENKSESKVLKELLVARLEASGRLAPAIYVAPTATAVPRPQSKEEAALARTTLRLPKFLKTSMAARARSMGFRPGKWLAALIQSNLLKQPVLTTPELFAVREASRELAAIGRNLNQIARAANAAALSPSRPSVDLSGVIEVLAVVERARAEIRDLVRASHQNWSTDTED